jgi:uncharacterized protein
MTADDLTTPLGREPTKRRLRLPFTAPQAIAAVLVLFLGFFVLWALVGDDPFGGEPIVAVPIHAQPVAMKSPDAALPAALAEAPPAAGTPKGAVPKPAAANKTITIIDGKTGARQEVAIAGESGSNPADAAPAAPPPGENFVELTPQGAVPKIAADGTRPAEAFARPVKALPGDPDAPRIAIIVTGLGIGAQTSAEAIVKLPGSVTLAFMPYSAGIDRLVARARGAGHEVLLQVPMEPFDYPANDPGPKTLLTSLTPQQNLERLYWLMSRFQGYVGIVGAMGARFTASEQAFAPILRETAKRGLIFLDDGANRRSVASRIAGGANLPFAKADIIIDSVPTPIEIDHALGRLEMTARERGAAVGIASALPVSIEHIAQWAQTAASRNVLLVPVTAVALKEKQS